MAAAKARPQGEDAAPSGVQALLCPPANDTEPHPDADLLALGKELAAAWAAEKEAPEGDAQDIAFDACAAIVAKISAKPASTMEGLRVKAQAFLWCGHEVGERAEDLICSRTMATDTMVAMSVLCDLTKM